MSSSESLNKWLFIVLNTGKELDNEVSTNSVEDDIKSHSLSYADLTRVDCSKKEDVQNNLLIPALTYLTKHLAEVDKEQMKDAQQMFDDCYKAYIDLCNNASRIVTGSPQAKLSLVLFANSQWDSIKPQITRELGAYYLELSDSKYSSCQRIKVRINQNKDNLYGFVPDLQWYTDRMLNMGPTDTAESVWNG